MRGLFVTDWTTVREEQRMSKEGRFHTPTSADAQAEERGIRVLAVTACVAGAYAVLLFLVVPRHEPWFDEAQAWLIARDAGAAELILDVVRYEGSPGLWHLLLLPAAQLGWPYATMQWIAAGLAVLGVVLFLYRCPLPLPLRLLIPFTFFVAYQYAVVARNYCLLPPLLWLAAVASPYRALKPKRYFLVLCLLANVSLHGTLIALSLGALHVWEQWRGQFRLAALRPFLGPYALFTAAIALVIVQLRPPADLASPAPNEFNLSLTHFVQVSADVLDGATAEAPLLTWPALGLSLIWFYCKQCLSIYLVPTLALLLLFSTRYCSPWHEGILFLVWVFALWQSFATPETNGFQRRYLRPAVMLCAGSVLLIQCSWARTALFNDYQFAYSGGKSVAEFLRENKLDNTPIYATSFHSISVLPYFADNRFGNCNNGGKPCYWRWAKKSSMSAGPGFVEKSTEASYAAILAEKPEIVLLGLKFPHQHRLLSLRGYRELARFPGQLIWKNRSLEPDAFVLLVREEPAPQKTTTIALGSTAR
jgi:hypothetical protein